MPGIGTLLNDPYGANTFRQQIGQFVNLEDFANSPGAQAAMEEMRRQGELTLNRSILPGINSQAAAFGALGDSNAALERARVRTDMGNNIQGGIGSFLSGLFGQTLGAYNSQAGQLDNLRLGALSNQTQRQGINAQRSIAQMQNETALKQLALQEALGFGEQNRLNALAGLQGQQFMTGLQMQQQNLPFTMLQQLLNTVLPIATNFGGSNTTGTNVVPGAPFNPLGAAINGGIGGVLGWRGLQQLGGSGMNPGNSSFNFGNLFNQPSGFNLGNLFNQPSGFNLFG